MASAPSSPARTDDRVAEERCTEKPPAGQLTQAPGGVSFRTGRVFVDVARLAPAAPGEVADPDPDTDATSGDGCHEFPKWGNDDPLVPPDSALFVFKSEGKNGVQIEAPIAELVSRRDVTAQIGVVAEGRYFQAISCALTMSSFTEDSAAGSFTCPNAVLVQANPFRPDDAIDPTDQSPEPQAPIPPIGVPGTVAPDAASTAVLSGWFELSR
ncbi:hypothetical protein [Williamsia phyllosphaerae]|uniref:Uncharacterized protein n=1 Tax=Williamsia phyllosphaerae TaxID=885042 RepID=A0ABQ1V2E0_9NOCA|nr:hypothetical protein [Williamsia phyllosphaerae]GGF33273.1 hypothetical protein GCM10007298_31400 [Williamsia phyllosphaerae]